MDRIAAAPDRLAHIILVALCEDGETLTRSMALLDKLEQRVEGASNGTKRKADDSALLVCVQCDQVFTEDENSMTACRYHEGELEPDLDGDFWADQPEFLEIDTPENRREFPEGFFWNCCGKHGDEDDPCSKGRHIAAGGQDQKRGRYDESVDSGSVDDDEEDYSGYEDGDGEAYGDPNGAPPAALGAVGAADFGEEDFEDDGEEDDGEEVEGEDEIEDEEAEDENGGQDDEADGKDGDEGEEGFDVEGEGEE